MARTVLTRRWEQLANAARHASTQPSIEDLISVLCGDRLGNREVASLGRPDPNKPYGRHVLFANDVLEGMVAQWTPGTPCAPHDHGGSHGAVRVISGEALHTVWAVEEGELVAMETTRHGVGDVLPAPPHMIHSMQDAGGDAPLITLHLYTDAIDHMVVYDRDSGRTCIVDGSCGAWIPESSRDGLRASYEGFIDPSNLPCPNESRAAPHKQGSVSPS